MFHYVSRKLLVWGLSFPASNNFILFAELPTVRASKDTHYTFWFQYVYSNTWDILLQLLSFLKSNDYFMIENVKLTSL